VVITREMLAAVRDAGACEEVVQKYHVGMDVTEVDFDDLDWVDRHLPALARECVATLLAGVTIEVRGNICLSFFAQSGYGYGYGYGYGSADGDGYGYGDGFGDGYGYGYGSADGDGYGDGFGYGYGFGDGFGYGYGSGYGYGEGYGDGSGFGAGLHQVEAQVG